MKKVLVIFALLLTLVSCNTSTSSENSASSGSNSSNKCSDMESYDFGYAVAQDQQALAADCDYLYDLAITQRNISSKTCFCKGVSDFRSSK